MVYNKRQTSHTPHARQYYTNSDLEPVTISWNQLTVRWTGHNTEKLSTFGQLVRSFGIHTDKINLVRCGVTRNRVPAKMKMISIVVVVMPICEDLRRSPKVCDRPYEHIRPPSCTSNDTASLDVNNKFTLFKSKWFSEHSVAIRVFVLRSEMSRVIDSFVRHLPKFDFWLTNGKTGNAFYGNLRGECHSSCQTLNDWKRSRFC